MEPGPSSPAAHVKASVLQSVDVDDHDENDDDDDEEEEEEEDEDGCDGD